MNIVATIEARMTSSRLPGKVLMPAAGQPMLFHLVRRLRAVPSLNEIVLATTTNRTDDVLEDFANNAKIRCYRGSEDDVMGRVIEAADAAAADIVVEITGDCPIIDPDLIEQTIRVYFGNGEAFTSNGLIRSYPDGMDVQVYRLDTLKQSAAMTDDPLDREHVIRHIRHHPELFRIVNLVAPPSLHWPELGLTLDELADYNLLKLIIEYFEERKPLFNCADVIALLRNRAEWVEINRAVVRKTQ